jgi:hypothetical protein
MMMILYDEKSPAKKSKKKKNSSKQLSLYLHSNNYLAKVYCAIVYYKSKASGVNMSSADDIDDELISLIPGTRLTVTSGFRDAKINMLSSKILRIALLICFYQVLLTLIFISLLLIDKSTTGAAVRLLDLVLFK